MTTSHSRPSGRRFGLALTVVCAGLAPLALAAMAGHLHDLLGRFRYRG